MNRTLLLLILALASSHVHAQYTQTLVLEPGWNAVYIEVIPEEDRIANLFDGLPIESVWRYLAVDGASGVPDNPGAGLRELEGWRGYYDPDGPAGAFSDLYTLRPNTAYLIELGGTSNATVTLTGTPVVEPRRWTPDGFTFTGFLVEPGAGPTFATYFEASSAQRDQPIYTLNAQDEWELVDPDQERIEAGRAYWVFSRGPSDFQGPLEAVLDPGFRDLDFGTRISVAGLMLINRASASQEVRLERAPGGETVPLEYKDTSDPQAPVMPWNPLDDAFPMVLGIENWDRLELAPRRAELAVNRAEQVLVFTTLDGARALVPTAAELPVYDPMLPPGSASGPPVGASALNAGLWVGTATVTHVNQTQSSAGPIDATGALAEAQLLPVAQEWPLRLLVHVDADGDFTLVSQVVQLFEEGSTQLVPVPGTPNVEERICVPGRTVLITQDENFSDYVGLSLRGDGFAGERLGTVAYDFGETDDMQSKKYKQALVYQDVPRNAYETEIRLASTSPSNPFYHPFHPDHDDLDEFFSGPAPSPEVPEIVRTISLNPCDRPGAFLNGEAWDPGNDIEACGADVNPTASTELLVGKFEDLITGLHKNPVYARGNFELRRFTTEDALDPDPLDLENCICDDQGVCP